MRWLVAEWLPRCLNWPVCCFCAPRSCGRWFSCRGSLQVVRRGHCPAADGGRGAAAEPPVRLRRGLHAGAPGHPLPEAGHAGHPPHRGELSWACREGAALAGTAALAAARGTLLSFVLPLECTQSLPCACHFSSGNEFALRDSVVMVLRMFSFLINEQSWHTLWPYWQWKWAIVRLPVLWVGERKCSQSKALPSMTA